jgi:acyl-CoA reductase-like NAD-dependent aldehyde dehydrogenase
MTGHHDRASTSSTTQLNAMRIAGRKVGAGRSADRTIAVFNPYTEKQIGSVPKATLERSARPLPSARRTDPR